MKKFIIVGGPSVPDNIDGKAEKFLKDNPCIDVCIHQEGERTVLKLLDEFPNNKFWILLRNKKTSEKRMPSKKSKISYQLVKLATS